MSSTDKLVFTSLPKDKLEESTPASTKSSSVVNSMSEATRMHAQKFLESFRATEGSGLMDSVKKSMSGITDLPDLTNRLKNLPGNADFKSYTADEAVTSVMGLIDGSYNPIYEIKDQLAGAMSLDRCSPWDAIRGLNSYFKDSHLFSIMDVGAHAALLAGMVRDAICAGMTGVFGQVNSLIDNEVVRRVVAVESAVAGIGYGAVDVVNQCIDVVGSDAILGRVTNLVPDYISGIRVPDTLMPSGYKQFTDDAFDTLGRLNPGWPTVKFGNSDIINTEALGSAQGKFREVMLEDDRYRDKLMLSSMEFNTDLSAVAKNLAPRSIYDL